MNDTYLTSDLILASFAVYSGEEIERLDRANPDRVLFVLSVDERWPRLLSDFKAGKAVVEPSRFYQALKATKSALLDNSLRRADEQSRVGKALTGGEVVK